MGQLTITQKKETDQITFEIQGHIDEDADFSSFSLSEFQKINLNLENIKGINSCGIREWIKWMSTSKINQQIIFKKCPKIIVDQINMVEGFLPLHAKVQSFYVPYYAEESGEEKSILFEEGNHFSGTQLKPPAQVLDSTGQSMEMDVLENKYFKFLQKK